MKKKKSKSKKWDRKAILDHMVIYDTVSDMNWLTWYLRLQKEIYKCTASELLSQGMYFGWPKPDVLHPGVYRNLLIFYLELKYREMAKIEAPDKTMATIQALESGKGDIHDLAIFEEESMSEQRDARRLGMSKKKGGSKKRAGAPGKKRGVMAGIVEQGLKDKLTVEGIIVKMKKVNPALKNPRGRIYKAAKKLGIEVTHDEKAKSSSKKKDTKKKVKKK